MLIPAAVPDAGTDPTVHHGQPPARREKLVYGVEWRLIRGGTAAIEKLPHETAVKLESAGIVSTLFRIQDVYTVHFEDSLCATSSMMDVDGRQAAS